MKVDLHAYREQDYQQQGAVIVLVAILISGLFSVAALAIDSWQILLIAREAQQAADSAALAGVEMLHIPPLLGCETVSTCYFPFTPIPWREIKKAVADAVAESKINGLDAEARLAQTTNTILFNSFIAQSTYDDESNYNKDSSHHGNLGIKVTRGIQCYNSRNELLWFSLEGEPGRWCRVNAVKVEISISNIPTGFMSMLGIVSSKLVKSEAIATRLPPFELNTCGNDQCSLLGVYNEVNSSFTPYPC